MRQRTWVVVSSVAFLAAGWAAGPLGSAPADAKGPASAEAVVELGRRLFLDPAASRGGKFSCASCHDPEHGFSDPRRHSQDETGPSKRHSQPVTDLGGAGFHWDGEFDNVRQLLVARLATPADAVAQAGALHRAHFDRATAAQASPDRAEFDKRMASLTPPYYGPITPSGPVTGLTPLRDRIAEDGRYDAAFKAAFGTPEVTTERMIDAMDAYLATLRTTTSPYDRFLAGDPLALSASAKHGLQLFEGKAGCAQCHPTRADGGARASLSDGQFHNTGVAIHGVALDFNQGTKIDGGRGEMSFVQRELGRFKTPSLRDVAKRAPYMHDGSFATLSDVVDYYAQGGTPNRFLDEKIRRLELSTTESRDLVAFLESLSGDERAGLAPAPDRKRTMHVRVLDPQGRPVPRLAIEVHPAGDRFAGRQPPGPAATVTTDQQGWVAIDFPLTTHTVLKTVAGELDLGRPIPDTVQDATLVLTPWDQVTVRVRRATKEWVLPQRMNARIQPRTGPGNAPPDAPLKVEFVRVRDVGPDEALYRAPVAKKLGGPQLVTLLLPDEQHNAGLQEIDFDGGASETIQLGALPRKPLDMKELNDLRARRQ